MASHQSRSKSPRPLTNLTPQGVSVERLASVIIARVLLDERAKSLPPKKAAAVRASDRAQDLARQETVLWKELCKRYAEFIFLPVRGGRPHAQARTTRVCNVLTSVSTAIVEAARKEFAHEL
jgi:hypothetical protein